MNSAAGSSDREMSKIEDSISYKLNALKETWIGFLQVAANRASIKIIIDFLTKISELLVKVLEMPGANVAVIGGAAIGLGALVQKAKEAASPLLTLSSIFKELFGKESPLSNVQNVEKGVIETVNKMKETAQSGTSSTQKTIWSASGQVLTVVDTETTKANTKANLENAASNEAKAASEIKDSAVKKDNIATTEADSVATEKNTAANKNNITSLLSLAKVHPFVTAGIVGATVAITTIITLYQKEKQSVEDLASSMEELGKTYETNKKQTNDNISSVQSLYKEYQQLAFGDTATEVLGGGGEEGKDEEGSGVIGQFATLKTKVEDVTAAIGSGEDSGGGGKSGGKGKGKGKGEDSGTLIEALKSEQEVALDEEKGLPAQNKQWENLEGNIQKCVDAVQRLIDKLSDLEEFSLTVNFSGGSGGGGAETDGTFASRASGSFPVTMHSYAKGSNVGLEHDQRALIGEVGYEGLVRQNRFSLIGKNGAEMMSLKKGDIIFSHSQTKELLKNGKIHSRGKAVGTHSYADGTPLKSALKFAGADYSSTQLAALATKLTGVMDGISVGVDSIERRTTELANKVPNVTTNTANKTSNVTIGDIHVSGVQDVDSFAKAVKSYLPGRMLQELHKN